MSALPGETLVRSSLESAEALSFGSFELDTRTGELRREGVLVPLAPQPARLLLTLASRPGELVTRSELRERVWDDGTFVDFERGLNFCVLQVRTALGDDARNPAYIETLPKRGYRFVAPVREVAPSRSTAPSPARIASAGLLTTRTLAAIVLTAVVLITIGFALRPRSAGNEPALTSTNPAAREAYLRGRQLYEQRSTPDVEASVRELRTAIRLEPRFALPYVALADALHALAMRERLPARDAALEIRAASRNALRLAPGYAGSHATTAMLHFWYEWDWAAAETSYRRAIALDPRDVSALHDHGWLLLVRGHFDDGIAEIRRAQELDPTSPRANTHVAWAYIYARRYADAIREANRALELSPEFREAYVCLEEAYRLSGNVAAAAEMRLKRGSKADPGDGRDSYANAVRHLRLGDRDGAMAWLSRAKEERNTSVPLSGVDPKLEPLHGDARFTDLLSSMGLTAVRPAGR